MSRVDDQARRIRELLDENRDLRDRIEAMEDAIADEIDMVHMCDLTGRERMVAALLARANGRAVRKSAIHAFIYSDRVDEADEKIVDVFICKMRPKLKPHGIEIETIWGEGYRISKGLDVMKGKSEPAIVKEATA